MYKVYLKQAWQMLKEDKVISLITIFGTALAITMIMVVVLTQRIKTKNVAPEVNRERTMYIKYTIEENINLGYVNINPTSIDLYKQYLSQLKEPENISLVSHSRSGQIHLEGSDNYLEINVKYTDTKFWKIFSLSFLKGKPFSEEEFQSGVPVAVICKSLAQKLYKGEDAIGKEFSMNKKLYRVTGIVEDVSTLCSYAFSQVWAPYSSNIQDANWCDVVLLAKDKKDFSKIKAEVRQSEIHNNIEKERMKVNFWGPFSEMELLTKEGVNNGDDSLSDPDLSKIHLKFYLTLAILLLIPAINLSGFSLFKIINRTSEIGIRKAFGANKKTILMQVLYENMMTSIIGGVIGLILSFIAVTLVKDRLFAQESWNPVFGENTIPISAFLSPAVFFYVFLACLMLNLLSSGIPAWRASRLNIVDAIKN